MLGLVLATLGVIGDSLVAVVAARTGRRMAAGAWRERITGSVLVALGVRLALVRRQVRAAAPSGGLTGPR